MTSPENARDLAAFRIERGLRRRIFAAIEDVWGSARPEDADALLDKLRDRDVVLGVQP